jgi:hypothetical protein
MRIDSQITKIIPYWMHVFVQDCGANKHKYASNVFLLYFFRNNYNNDFCNLPFSGDVAYKERWWH